MRIELQCFLELANRARILGCHVERQAKIGMSFCGAGIKFDDLLIQPGGAVELLIAQGGLSLR